MTSGPALPMWEEEGCGGTLAREALPEILWSTGPLRLDTEEVTQGALVLSAASGS